MDVLRLIKGKVEGPQVADLYCMAGQDLMAVKSVVRDCFCARDVAGLQTHILPASLLDPDLGQTHNTQGLGLNPRTSFVLT